VTSYRPFFSRAVFCLLVFLTCVAAALGQGTRWTEQRANDWYAKQPWLVGSNYIPKDAINELEMWQADTFDPQEIDLELGWAEGMGMNTMRVFLHDLLWQDPQGFHRRLDQFLAIAARHHIRPLLVLFDSCWDPLPQLGVQHPPIPGIHNSGWVQSPGARTLADPTQVPRLKTYVQGVVGAFAKDDRILGWDVWNEPGSDTTGSYPKTEMKMSEKLARVAELLPQAFAWAREMNPTQPLTSGVWDIDLTQIDAPDEIQRIQLRESDVITFHNYNWPESFKAEVEWLRRLRRPVICTEYMARSVGSTFDTILPVAKQERVGAINWGFVAGKTQTYYPWESWQHPYILHDPPVWFHEVLRPDGTPYRKAEVELIRQLTSASIQVIK
jgi:Cellulase (glycosyl hydrolase family 5)